MVIFNKFNQQPDHSANITTIATGSSFTGKVEIECILRIDGKFSGEIHSDNIVEVGKLGSLQGEVFAQKLVVAGKFSGSAECESIELMAGGETEGRLTANSLAVDCDCSFQGESIVKQVDKASSAHNKGGLSIKPKPTVAKLAVASTDKDE